MGRFAPFPATGVSEIDATDVAFRWFIGLMFSLVLAHFLMPVLMTWLRAPIKKKAGDKYDAAAIAVDVSTARTGLIERLFFLVVVAFNLGGGAVAMIAWIAMKMMENWSRLNQASDDTIRSMVFSAFLGSLMSMFFAMIGGLIAGGQIPLPTLGL